MKVAIAGFGKEGESNYRYWKTRGNEVSIFDENETPTRPLPPDATAVCGTGALSRIRDFDLVVRTASLAPSKLPTGSNTWSGTREFFAQCPAPIIGVTGTKGKGTTSSMIAGILRAAGKNTWLVGNIGTPAIDILDKVSPTDIVVFELSSFQLWDLDQSPHVAVVLGIEPDHLDVHASFEDYISAKANIALHQENSDIIVFKSNNSISASIAHRSAGTQIGYGPGGITSIHDGYFYYSDTKLFPSSVLHVPGNHNKENACAAIAAVWPYVQDPTILSQGLGTFIGLPHRIEKVRELHGVTFYDDSFSSAPSAAIVAAQSFTAPTILILGGHDRGIDLLPLIQALNHVPSIKKLLLIGTTRKRLASACDTIGEHRYEVVDMNDFASIIRHAHEQAAPGDVVLLSPGAPSFDMFKNFTERGDAFKNIVMSL